MTEQARTRTRTTILLPDALHDRLRKAAERERRSVHSQMLVYIERGLDQDESQPAGRSASDGR
jgi:predicted transcriptional regulator